MIEVKVSGVSYSQSQVGSYVVVLSEVGGFRKLTIIVGLNEAESIALKMEGFKAPYPKTYDFIKTFMETFDIECLSADIQSFNEGIFKCNLNFTDNNVINTSVGDAITISFLNDSPIFVSEHIMDSYAITVDDDGTIKEPKPKKKAVKKPTLESLNKELEKAIENEDYLKAAQCRDKIKKLTEWENGSDEK
jgi:bifunctional DNase/RNase